MANRYYETSDRHIYMTVNENEMQIKQRYADERRPDKIWKIYIPEKEEDSPWNCVNYLAFKAGWYLYEASHKQYIPACDLTMLRLELEKRLKINMPQKAFDKFEALSIAKALVKK